MNAEHQADQRAVRTPAGGITLLDATAMIAGAAVASVHLRRVAPEPLAGPGWALMWLTFSGVAITATGPFLLLVRRWSSRPETPRRLGDWLWGMLGAPWVLAVLPRVEADMEATPGSWTGQFYEVSLAGGVGLASMVTLVIVWSRWVATAPRSSTEEDEPTGWTHRLGLALAVAWPLQCGFVLVVLGAPA